MGVGWLDRPTHPLLLKDMNLPKFEQYIYHPILKLYLYTGSDYQLGLQPIKRGRRVNLYSIEGNLIYSECTELYGPWSTLQAYEAALPILAKLIKAYEQDQDKQDGPDRTSTSLPDGGTE